MSTNKRTRWQRIASLCIVLATASAGVGRAQDEPERKLGWSDTAELSFVVSGGNAEANTLGLRNSLSRTWERSIITIDASALRASTGTISRLAVGSSVNDFAVRKESTSAVTAENYLLRGRYDRNVTDRLFWFVGAGWDRNVFTGIQNRFEGIGGVGNTWFENDDRAFKTTYGLSIVNQEDVVSNPEVDSTFMAAQLSSDYRRTMGGASYANLIIVNQNLQATGDLRFDMVNSFSVSLVERLALKLTHQLLFDNQPSLVAIPLVRVDGTALESTVLVPLDKVDTIFTLAVVIDF
jgi:hypothetical protein